MLALRSREIMPVFSCPTRLWITVQPENLLFPLWKIQTLEILVLCFTDESGLVGTVRLIFKEADKLLSICLDRGSHHSLFYSLPFTSCFLSIYFCFHRRKDWGSLKSSLWFQNQRIWFLDSWLCLFSVWGQRQVISPSEPQLPHLWNEDNAILICHISLRSWRTCTNEGR